MPENVFGGIAATLTSPVIIVAGGNAVRTREPYLDFAAVRYLDAGNPA